MVITADRPEIILAKTLLIFPPFWEPTQPYLALPALSSYLRHHGYSVEQWDLNLDFHDTVIAADWLAELVVTRGAYLKSQQVDIAAVLAGLPQIDDAKALLRSPRYYDPDAFIQARATLEKAYNLLSALYYPTQISIHSLVMYARSSSSLEVTMAAQDRQANPFIEFYERRVLARIEALQPTLIGLSIADITQIIPAMTLAFMIRERWPLIHVTVGGSLFSKFAGALQQQPRPAFELLFHSVVKGEGEIPLLGLVQALEQGTDLATVPGLVYPDAQGQVQINPPGEPMSMNDIWAPDFDGLPLERYWAPEVILPVLGSRDCYWKDCTFCDHYVTYAPQYRVRKPELMADDLAELVTKYQARHFSFGDETMSPHYARRLAEGILARNLDFSWSMLSRLQKGFDPETCNLLRQSGCTYVMLGLESANPQVSAWMEKGTVNQRSVEVYQNLDQAGIYNFSFVFFGFPGETREMATETMQFITEHHRYMHAIGAGTFSLKKYSPMFRHPERYGVVALDPNDVADDWTVDVGFSVDRGMTPAEAQAFYREFSQHVWDLYRVPLWMVENSRSTVFLYLNHYGKDWMQQTSFRDRVQVVLL